ncbi:hypothetical protein [Psychrobacter sp.]|uniref:hypothetical protein n=1 Tax=Psychrobacter sp. TaxID=56811 RepID=UPI003C7245F0
MKKLLFGLITSLSLVGCDAAVDAQMDSTYDKVSEDMVTQYDIAKKQGDAMQTCVQAGMVSAAYLQAKDEAKYNEWKAIEKADCKAAGIDK